MKPKIEIGPKCPRCKCEDVTRERNFGKPIKDGRWWCMKCGHLWRTPALLSVACPYCKAAIGEPCSVNRRNVSIVVLGVHRPRARHAQRTTKLDNLTPVTDGQP